MNSLVKKTVFEWVDKNRDNLSNWNKTIWDIAEPAWREYESSKFFIDFILIIDHCSFIYFWTFIFVGMFFFN